MFVHLPYLRKVFCFFLFFFPEKDTTESLNAAVSATARTSLASNWMNPNPGILLVSVELRKPFRREEEAAATQKRELSIYTRLVSISPPWKQHEGADLPHIWENFVAATSGWGTQANETHRFEVSRRGSACSSAGELGLGNTSSGLQGHTNMDCCPSVD